MYSWQKYCRLRLFFGMPCKHIKTSIFLAPYNQIWAIKCVTAAWVYSNVFKLSFSMRNVLRNDRAPAIPWDAASHPNLQDLT